MAVTDKRISVVRSVRQALYDSSKRVRHTNLDDHSITIFDVLELLDKQNWKCEICKISLWHRRQLDHIVPLSRGGRHTLSNIQWLCPSCNWDKKDRLLYPYDGPYKKGVLPPVPNYRQPHNPDRFTETW